MNASRTNLGEGKNRKGIALLTVVSMLALITIMTVAMLTMSQNERTTSDQQFHQERARELADVAVNVVMGQIWQGTKQDSTSAGREIWASQPGAVRKYKSDGSFHSGYRTYSSSKMVVSSTDTEKAMTLDSAPGEWNTKPERYVDLNEPVVRPPLSGSTEPIVYFPIIDPRAYVRSAEGLADGPNVEGFFYDTKSSSGSTMNGVVDAKTADDTAARLPMPVEWMYVLKDGTLGTLNDQKQFLKPDGSLLSLNEAANNPISGRVAFWTDDESCKLNINTASEPTYWATPSLFHDRDLSWAQSQPTSNEYQRYAGHPATVALSTVFFPNQSMDLYGKDPSSADYQKILRKKESIYALAPKVTMGGSKAGTEQYWKFIDNYQQYKSSLYKKNVDLTNSIKERLYASIDELYFSQNVDGSNKRQVNYYYDDKDAVTTNSLFSGPTEKYDKDKISLEKLRFFLTTQSRMPEVNMFGTPRIAIWPIADEKGIFYQDEASGNSARTKYRGSTDDYRTGYDKLIAFCSSMGAKPDSTGKKSYYFRRKNAYSKTDDVSIQRNANLLSYVEKLMNEKTIGGGSFVSKYTAAECSQIATEIFDYIRATNLYDGFLSPDKETLQAPNGNYAVDSGNYSSGQAPSPETGLFQDGQLYRKRPTDFRTYTYDRSSKSETRGGSSDSKVERQVEGNFPGHGMVVPTERGASMGFGRFVTLSEVGFHFICTADGTPDKGNYAQPIVVGPNTYKKGPVKSGGRTAVKIARHSGGGQGTAKPLSAVNKFTKDNDTQFWYSNFPPYPSNATMTSVYGVNPAETDTNKPTYPANHPGCQPQNWNATLDRGQPPLASGQRRIQGMLVMKLSMVAAGATELNPEFAIEIEGLKDVAINGTALYDSGDGKLVYKSPQSLFDGFDCRPVGGCASLQAMTAGRRIGTHNQVGMISDVGYDASASVGGDPHRGTRNLDLTTKFFTVDTTGGNPTMKFTGAKLKISLYSSHLITPANLCQTFEVDTTALPKNLPVPELVTLSADYEQFLNSDGSTTTQEATDAPRWWAFNYDGAIGRFTGNWSARQGWGTVAQQTSFSTAASAAGSRTLGRFFKYSSNDNAVWTTGHSAGVPRGASTMWAYDPATSGFNDGVLNPSSPPADVSGDYLSDTGLSDTQANSDGTPRDSRGQDTIVTMVPAAGDTRIVAAQKSYNSWVPHPRCKFINQSVAGTGSTTSFRQFVAHGLSRFYSGRDPGADRGSSTTRLVQNATYGGSYVPELPSDLNVFAKPAWKYGDFDNAGFYGLRDGAYINKPDEGDAAISFHYYGPNNAQTVRLPNAYLATLDYGWLFSDSGESFMTPNRMIPSPGMFGSLPTGVKSNEQWRTLLFRPNLLPAGTGRPQTANHTGAAGWQGGKDPADHYLMDLFWMPIVEPYAISEPFSTAGKVNINYQMVPFSHIRRATGVHAVFKGELLKAIPLTDAPSYNSMPATTRDIKTDDDYVYRQPWTDIKANRDKVKGNSLPNLKVWHRNIETEKRVNGNVLGTLQQFQDRFNFVSTTSYGYPSGGQAKAGLFRTASEICEVHLIPQKVINKGDGDDTAGGSATTPYTVAEMSSKFWAARTMTGDNTREKPYTNIYAKITTQSNTFRVHYRAQAIKKARSSNANEFNPDKDSILTDYRGSSLIERRIDPSDTRIPDYADPGTNPVGPQTKTLDDFYRFRVLEVKRFMP